MMRLKMGKGGGDKKKKVRRRIWDIVVADNRGPRCFEGLMWCPRFSLDIASAIMPCCIAALPCEISDLVHVS